MAAVYGEPLHQRHNKVTIVCFLEGRPGICRQAECVPDCPFFLVYLILRFSSINADDYKKKIGQRITVMLDGTAGSWRGGRLSG